MSFVQHQEVTPDTGERTTVSNNQPPHVTGGANLSRDERKCIEGALDALDELRAHRPSMTVSQATALLHVALNEGMSIGDLAVKMGVAQSVMSRHMLDLGPYTRSKEPGANLVQHRMSATNLRVHEVIMTAKGAGLMRRIVKLLCR